MQERAIQPQLHATQAPTSERPWGSRLSFLRKYRTEAILILIALALYLPGLGWGLPYATDPVRNHGWATDSLTPLEPLSQVHNLIRPKPDQYLGYPLMHHLVLSAVYAPYLLYLLVTGRWSSPQPQFPFGFSDVEGALNGLEMLGKLVAMCMAAGIAAAACHIGRTLWGYAAGLLSGVFAMLMFPMFYYSRTGNLDVPVLFWTSLGLAVYAHILKDGVTTRRAVWLGIFAAFAVATKDQGWGAFALLPPVLVAAHARRAGRQGIPFSWRPLLAGGVSCVIAYGLSSGLAIDPSRHFAHLAWIRHHVPFPLLENFPPTLAGYAGLLRQTLGHLADANGPLMAVTAAAGLLLLSRRDPLMLAMGVPALGHFLLVLVPVRVSLLRYVMPIAFIVCLLAARTLAEGWNSSGWRKALSATVTAAICGWLLLLGADLTYQMWTDSHYEAAVWLEKHTRPGDLVGSVASYSYLPRLKSGIRYFPIPHSEEAAEEILKRRPGWVIVMPDWTSPKNAMLPKRFPGSVYERLQSGALGYQQAARFTGRSLVKRQILDYPTVNPPIEVWKLGRGSN